HLRLEGGGIELETPGLGERDHAEHEAAVGWLPGESSESKRHDDPVPGTEKRLVGLGKFQRQGELLEGGDGCRDKVVEGRGGDRVASFPIGTIVAKADLCIGEIWRRVEERPRGSRQRDLMAAGAVMRIHHHARWVWGAIEP